MDNKNKNNVNSIPQNEDFVKSIKSNLTSLADAIAEMKYQESYLPILTLKECIQYFKDESQKIASTVVAEGFVLSIKKNYDPRNENDRFIVIQALLNANQKPIVVNGETVSRTLHTKTIDEALIRAMDGNETRVFSK